MNLILDCIPCLVNGFLRESKTISLSEEKKETVMRHLLSLLSEADYCQPPPALGKEIHQMLRQELNGIDPYLDIKAKYNRMMLEKYPVFENMVTTAEDPFDMALRLAIAGNVIDFGPNHQIDVMATINRVVNTALAIDDSQMLKRDLHDAKTVLYIGDNCGEIVLDKLFLETIGHPNIYFAVRGRHVLNDVTVEDAKMVGIDEVAKVITTGDNAPGVIWNTSSVEFQNIFNKADVIIAKGQGNLESLMERQQNIYYLLITKCEMIANHIGVKVGDFVTMRSRIQDRTVKKNSIFQAAEV